jgi:hypothetical protein
MNMTICMRSLSSPINLAWVWNYETLPHEEWLEVGPKSEQTRNDWNKRSESVKVYLVRTTSKFL